jgi:hypothetical protein
MDRHVNDASWVSARLAEISRFRSWTLHWFESTIPSSGCATRDRCSRSRRLIDATAERSQLNLRNSSDQPAPRELSSNAGLGRDG